MAGRWFLRLGACGGAAGLAVAAGAAHADGGGGRGDPVVVVGGGVMGSATAYYLAKRGVPCVLVDDGNPFKSSWGETRIARDVQFEPVFRHLMKRALTLWNDLEKAEGEDVLIPMGIVTLADSPQLRTLRDLNDSFGNEYQDLTAAECTERFPAFSPPAELDGGIVFQRGGWAVLAQTALSCFQSGIVRCGGSVVENNGVVSIDRGAREVTLEGGEVLRYRSLVLTCGPDTNAVLQTNGLRRLKIMPSVEEQLYYTPRGGSDVAVAGDGVDALHTVERLPLVLDVRSGQNIYMIPHVPGGVNGVKVAVHRAGPFLSTPATCPELLALRPKFREHSHPSADDSLCCGDLPLDNLKLTPLVNSWVARFLPHLEPVPAHSYRCVYTNSVDGHPAMGVHPDDPNIVVLCAFGGEGFKFAPAYGEAAALCALHEEQAVCALRDDPFDPARLLL